MSATKKLSQRLPNKMSSLLLLALADLERTEQDSRYTILMSQWHNPSAIGPCEVCLAGSVLAQRFLNPSEDYLSHMCKLKIDAGDVRNKLSALNFLRQGYVLSAAGRLNLLSFDDTSFGKFDREIVSYSTDSKKFKQQLRKLANDLKKHGH